MLILRRHVYHGHVLIGVEPDGLTVGVDGAVHFTSLARLATLEVPEVSILEVQLAGPQLVGRLDCLGPDVKLVDSLIYIEKHERLFDVPQVVELNLPENPSVPLSVSLWNLTFVEGCAHARLMRLIIIMAAIALDDAGVRNLDT